MTASQVQSYWEQSWQYRHQLALVEPDEVEAPIVNVLTVLDSYDRQHVTRFGSGLARDYVLGAAWLEIAKAARTLLNGDLGRLDGGSLDKILLDLIRTAGFDENEL